MLIFFSIQDMSQHARPTFTSIFEGKQDVLEKIIDTDHGLLAVLVANDIITTTHREAIKVSLL